MQIKKSAVDLTDLALGIIVLGVVVSIGAVLLVNYRDARLSDLHTFTVANESTFLNNTGDRLSQFYVKSVDSCINGTSNTVIPSTNYTVTIDTSGYATLKNATVSSYNVANCTYTSYNTSQADYALADDAATGIGEFGNWFKIITIVGVASVVLALIFMAFGRRSGDSTSY